MTTTAGSDVVQSGRPIFDDFFQHLWPYIGNSMANVVFQMVKRLWLIRIDQNEKVSNHGSITITIGCNVVAFIVFEEGFHQPIKRTKQSVFLDVTVFRHTIVD
ncbi:hypothetical protein TNCV_3365201 [Trichonephila clavipes]|nr:hypothetical protein TNCV_3365201 [Trichonephila clavipes]